MAIAEGGFRPGPDFPGAESNTVDPATARLRCIEEAVKRGFTPDPQWADWLKAGVKVIEDGGVVTPEWLSEFDRQNAYI